MENKFFFISFQGEFFFHNFSWRILFFITFHGEFFFCSVKTLKLSMLAVPPRNCPPCPPPSAQPWRQGAPPLPPPSPQPSTRRQPLASCPPRYLFIMQDCFFNIITRLFIYLLLLFIISSTFIIFLFVYCSSIYLLLLFIIFSSDGS